jgi:hypothetical protein
MLEKLPVTENYYYVAFIAALTFALTMITAKGSLTDHRFKWYKWKRYTSRGKQAIIFGFIVALALFFQDINNRNISNKKDTELKAEQNSKNSQITAAVRSNRQQLFNDLSVAFKNQGIQFVTIQNQIGTLKNLNKTSNNIPPLLHVKNLELVDNLHKGNRYNFLYEIISDNAVSYNTNLLFDIYGFTWEGKIVALDFNQNALYKGQTVAKDLSVKGNLTIIVNYNITTYAFRLKGNYKSSDGTKIPIDEFSLLQINNNKTSLELTSQYYETALREFIKENKF